MFVYTYSYLSGSNWLMVKKSISGSFLFIYIVCLYFHLIHSVPFLAIDSDFMFCMMVLCHPQHHLSSRPRHKITNHFLQSHRQRVLLAQRPSRPCRPTPEQTLHCFSTIPSYPRIPCSSASIHLITSFVITYFVLTQSLNHHFLLGISTPITR